MTEEIAIRTGCRSPQGDSCEGHFKVTSTKVSSKSPIPVLSGDLETLDKKKKTSALK